MTRQIRRAAVVGAGTMGAQIAAHLANQGIPCDLLDIVPSSLTEDEAARGLTLDHPDVRNRFATGGLERLRKLKPSPVYAEAVLGRIVPGNLEDHMDRLAHADWVVEAVVEDLGIKHALWARVARHVRPDAILSSNTSGIPIRRLAEVLPPELRRNFLGTHFFNPVRYLPLLELIPTADTAPEVVTAFQRFGEDVLGKGVVVAKDTPNFIGNRVGCYGLMVALQGMEKYGLRVDEVDDITGPVMGRPRSATFRTLDLVGLDVFAHVARNLVQAVTDEAERAAFRLPPYVETMLERKWHGDKTGQGFYKKVKAEGKKEILTLNLKTLEYEPRVKASAPSLQAAKGIEDVRKRVRTLVEASDPAGQFAWYVLKKVLLYTAHRADEMAGGDLVAIDRAMRWGYGWELGPFEIWDGIGVKESVARMKAEGEDVPAWVEALAGSDTPFFYKGGDDPTHQFGPSSAWVAIPPRPNTLTIARLRSQNRTIAQNPGATFLDMGDGVALVDFHSPKQAIGADFIGMIRHAVEEVRRNFLGLVVSSHVRPNFCVGANLFLVLLAASEGEWDEIDTMVREFQQAILAMRYLEKPVVVAPYGLTLGGGVEITFGADRVVAAAETYLGLVEVGAGVLPAGGGCKEMLRRAVEGVPGTIEYVSPATGIYPAPKKASAAGMPPDLQALVNRAFESIATARVATSALEARGLGYLRGTDVIVVNPDQLLHRAKQEVLALHAAGYRPPERPLLPALGPGAAATMVLGAWNFAWAGHATEYDVLIARKVARVLTGGQAPAGSLVDEQYLLDLEREAFLELCGEQRTRERMQAILTTGKPLRN